MWTSDHAKGVVIHVFVVPRASRTKVVGIHDDRLKVQLTAPPVDGAANAALLEFVVRELDVRKGEVELVSGDTNRRKSVLVVGLTQDDVRRVLRL